MPHDPPLDPAAAAAAVKQAARAAGFDLVGIARAEPLDPAPLDRWLSQGHDGGLWYVRNSRDERLDPARVLPGVKSVISVAVSYAHDAAATDVVPGHGVVARYARGRDYHNVFRRPLKRLRADTERIISGTTGYASNDTRPVMEKAWAQRAGLGWIGKNGCFIAPPFGSFVLLGCVLTTAELTPDAPHPDRCGTCVACLSSCPTGAIPEPRYVDARKCLAFHTIEHAAPFPDDVARGLSGRLFGCDLCQDVCPWNRDPELTGRALHDAMRPVPDRALVPLNVLRGQDDAAIAARFAGTALMRAGPAGLRRTADALARDATEPPSADD